MAVQTDWSYRLTQARICSFPLVISHLTATTRNENFLAYFVRILNSCVVYKFQTVNPGCPTYPTRIPTDRLLFHKTFEQRCIFAVVNRADVALSVFYSLVLTRCTIFLQSWTAASWRPLIKFMFITVKHCSLQQRVKRLCVEWYAQGRGRMEAWRGHFSLCPFKRGATGVEVPFQNSIIGNSWLIKIDFKQIYCSYSDTQKTQNDFL